MKVSIPKGTQDFLPAASLSRRFLMDHLTRVFEQFGFEPLETPAFEKVETLLGKYGEEGEKLIFRILKRGEGASTGESDLALRYDLTVPLARVVAMYPDLPKPFKRYQVAPVWRAEKPQRGRYREFYQCDADVAGSTSPVVEIELLAMAHQVYSGLGFERFALELNHRRVLSGLIHAAGIPPELEVGTLITLDKLDKIGPEGVRAELRARALDDAQLGRLDALLELRGDNPTVLAALEDMLAGHEAGLAGIENLRTILSGLHGSGVPSDRVRVNPVLARGLGYYTGAIYEVTLEGFGSSIGSGGRYDNLVGMFSGRTVPACGFSFGLDRMLLLLGERNLLPALSTATQVLVALYADDLRDQTLAIASSLRAAGLRVDVYPDAGRLGNQMQYGSARGIPFAVIFGRDEAARGVVTVRDLRTRVQEEVRRDALEPWLHARLERG